MLPLFSPHRLPCCFILVFLAMVLNISAIEQVSPRHIATLRKQMGAPVSPIPKLQILTISITERSQKCVLINAGSFLLPQSINSVIQLGGLIDRVVIMGNERDKSALQFASMIKDSQITIDKIAQDRSVYQFLFGKLSSCHQLVYLQANFVIQNIQFFKTHFESEFKPGSCLFSDGFFDGNQQVKLRDLDSTNLQNISPVQLSQYLFIFDPIYFTIITPLNFAFYNRYTVDEMIIFPILALLQKSGHLRELPTNIYTIDNPVLQSQQYDLSPAPFLNTKTLCFISLPINPHQYQLQSFDKYFENLLKNQGTQQSVLVVYAPYNYTFISDAKQSLLPIGLKLIQNIDKFRMIRFRILANKTVSSLAGYESAYTYCPSRSILVISRQNILFTHNFITVVQGQISPKFHYYVTRYIQNNRQSSLRKLIARKFRKRYKKYQMFNYVQIIKSDLFKSIYFWLLKSQEIDFYETEASFIIPTLEYINLSYSPLKIPLFKVIPRLQTDVEKQEVNNLIQYYRWPPSPQKLLNPYKYNALSNCAFKRYARPKIPKKIHQIWLGNKTTTKLQDRLVQTLKGQNPSYQYKLWSEKDITPQTFPYTYSMISKLMQYQEHYEKSIAAISADLLRLEILLRYGGIYLDFKTEGLKPLDPFLKYEIFFIDMDYTNVGYGNPRFIGNTFIGSTVNNYYLNMILTEIITEENIDPYSGHLPKMTGAFPIRQAFHHQQIFRVPGFGFHLFSQYPNTDDPLKCSKPDHYSSNQDMFELNSLTSKKVYKIGIPCKQYPQSYLVMYKQLGRTWK